MKACSAKPSTSGIQIAKLETCNKQKLNDEKTKPVSSNERLSKITHRNTEPISKSHQSQEVIEIDDDENDKKPLKILITKIKSSKIELSCALCQSKIFYDIDKFDENARQNSLEIICDCFEKVCTKVPNEAVSLDSNERLLILLKSIKIYSIK